MILHNILIIKNKIKKNTLIVTYIQESTEELQKIITMDIIIPSLKKHCYIINP